MTQKEKIYHGIALVLNYQEYKEFAKEYARQWYQKDAEPLEEGKEPGTSEDLFKVLMGYGDFPVQDLDFVRSGNHSDVFHFEDVDMAEGCLLFEYIPYFLVDGLVNGQSGQREVWNNWDAWGQEQEFFAVFTDYSRETPEGVNQDPYPGGYDDVLGEFQEKLQGYLPEDFPWKYHIGLLSYVRMFF